MKCFNCTLTHCWFINLACFKDSTASAIFPHCPLWCHDRGSITLDSCFRGIVVVRVGRVSSKSGSESSWHALAVNMHGGRMAHASSICLRRPLDEEQQTGNNRQMFFPMCHHRYGKAPGSVHPEHLINTTGRYWGWLTVPSLIWCLLLHGLFNFLWNSFDSSTGNVETQSGVPWGLLLQENSHPDSCQHPQTSVFKTEDANLKATSRRSHRQP